MTSARDSTGEVITSRWGRVRVSPGVGDGTARGCTGVTSNSHLCCGRDVLGVEDWESALMEYSVVETPALTSLLVATDHSKMFQLLPYSYPISCFTEHDSEDLGSGENTNIV